MKLSDETLVILNHCAKYNQHLVVNNGNKISSLTLQRNRLMIAVVPDCFPEFCIHNLSGFLKQLTLFDVPNIEFNDTNMVITDNEATSTYTYSNKDDLCYLDKTLKSLESDFNFNLKSSALDKILRASAANGTEDIALVGNGKFICIKAYDKNKPNRIFSVELEKSNQIFCVHIKHERKNKLQLMPNIDYNVDITKSGIIIFKSILSDNQLIDITFYIASDLQ